MVALCGVCGISGVLVVENSVDVEWNRYQLAFSFFSSHLKRVI